VEVIARDRSNAYAEGARQGAATATQVADRFHLLQNLREALDQVFLMQSQALDAVNALVGQQPVLLSDGALGCPCAPSRHPPACPAARGAAPDTPAGAAYADLDLTHQGWTAPAIAQQVGLSLRTVQRDLRATTFCRAQTAQRPGGQCAQSL